MSTGLPTKLCPSFEPALSSTRHPSRVRALLHQLEEAVNNLPAPQLQQIERFRALYLEHLGVELNSSQALEQLTNLLVIARYKQLETQYQQFLREATHSATTSKP